MILFPDSNIFIHFEEIEKWDWDNYHQKPSAIGLCMCIIGELDKIKYSANSNSTKRRIQQLVKKISTSKDLVFNGIPFSIFSPEVLNEILQKRNLDVKDKDDVFIASVLCYIDANSTKESTIITNDLGVQLKCRAHQINYIVPPEKYLIVEHDSAEKEIKKLATELNRFKNLQPKLSLRFQNGETFKTFDINEPRISNEDEIFSEINDLKQKHPILESDESTSPLLSFELYKKTPEKVSNFNLALEEFFKKYEVFLRKTKIFDYKKSLTVILNLEIKNEGTTPAEDIDLHMHFPDGFTLVNKERYFKKESPPSPPNMSHYSLAPFEMPNIMDFIHPSIPKLNLGGLSITKTNSYDVDDYFKSIKHNHSGTIEPLYAVFDNFEEAQSFEIEYKITAGNMVEIETGKLHIVINKIPDTWDEDDS